MTFIHHLKVAVGADLRLFANWPNSGTTCTSTLCQTLRPNMLVDIKGSIYVIELTVPYETNCKKAKRRKKERYRHIRFELISPCCAFTAITLEVTTLGFVSKDIHKFCRLLRTLEINDERIIKKNVWK